MARWLLSDDGTFSTAARIVVAVLVTAGFAAGYLARPTSDRAASGGASRAVAQSRIEADLPAATAQDAPKLTSAAALPGLAKPPRRSRARLAPQPTATPEPIPTAEPVEAPLETPTPVATPVATPAPPAPAPPPPPPPKPTPAGETFDSSG